MKTDVHKYTSSIVSYFVANVGNFITSMKERPMNQWIAQCFSSKAAKNGRTVRRSKSSVAENASYEMLKAEVDRRGYQLVELANDYLIICRQAPLNIALK